MKKLAPTKSGGLSSHFDDVVVPSGRRRDAGRVGFPVRKLHRASAEAVHRATLAAEIALLLGIPCSRLPALVQFGLVGIIFLGSRCPARFSPPLARHCGGPALHFLLPLEVSLLEPS